MDDNASPRPDPPGAINLSHPLAGFDSLVESLFAQSQAARWQLPLADFVSALERSVQKRFVTGGVTPRKLEEYLSALYLEDFALAWACAQGSEAGWEHFVSVYRSYLRAAAGAILRGGSRAADPQELADSLFAELFGLEDGQRGQRSLFRYFHGRSSLKTWLRAVLAQRHIDAIRAGRRFESLPENDGETNRQASQHDSTIQPADPHRARYVALFTHALQAALEHLERQDKERLRWYYAEQQTLAEVGRQLGEHESSVSRNLERVRRELRIQVEEILRAGRGAVDGLAAMPGLSDAQLALCFEYAAEDAPIDLDKLFPAKGQQDSAPGRRES